MQKFQKLLLLGWILMTFSCSEKQNTPPQIWTEYSDSTAVMLPGKHSIFSTSFKLWAAGGLEDSVPVQLVAETSSETENPFCREGHFVKIIIAKQQWILCRDALYSPAPISQILP